MQSDSNISCGYYGMCSARQTKIEPSHIDTTRNLCPQIILLYTYILEYTRKRQACMDNVLIDGMHRVLSYMHTLVLGNNISIYIECTKGSIVLSSVSMDGCTSLPH